MQIGLLDVLVLVSVFRERALGTDQCQPRPRQTVRRATGYQLLENPTILDAERVAQGADSSTPSSSRLFVTSSS